MTIVYKNPWFQIIKDKNYHFLKENGTNSGAIVLVLVDDDFLFIKVNRPAHKAILLETPRGSGDAHESSEQTAVREVYEETGYQFKVEDLINLGTVRPNTAILTAIVPVFLVESNKKITNCPKDTEEVLGVQYLSKSMLKNEIVRGNITDGITLSALALYWARETL